MRAKGKTALFGRIDSIPETIGDGFIRGGFAIARYFMRERLNRVPADFRVRMKYPGRAAPGARPEILFALRLRRPLSWPPFGTPFP